mmetsp:Transcript_19499/g.14186  ORF Transcript_19499/g.14186 Transcript_19499/m.14186 type:complete len:92 (+) Transcript_19499:1366-1641(+)
MAQKEGLMDKEVIEDADGYHYRLDALWLFQLVHEHVSTIVNEIYPNDEAVKKDIDLQNYVKFLKQYLTRYNTSLETREDVARHAANVWWVC